MRNIIAFGAMSIIAMTSFKTTEKVPNFENEQSFRVHCLQAHYRAHEKIFNRQPLANEKVQIVRLCGYLYDRYVPNYGDKTIKETYYVKN